MTSAVSVAAPSTVGSQRPPSPPGVLTAQQVTSAPPPSGETALLQALAATARVGEVAIRQGRGGPWLVSFVVSLAVSIGAWGLHMVTGDRQILDRLDALERAQDDRWEHDQWVVGALVALSKGEPLPPPPAPRRPRERP